MSIFPKSIEAVKGGTGMTAPSGKDVTSPIPIRSKSELASAMTIDSKAYNVSTSADKSSGS